MPWVEETLRHDNFLDDMFDKVFRRFKDKSGNYWWQNFNNQVPKVDLYKITFEKGLFVKGEEGYLTPFESREGMLCITRHMIMRRWDNEYLAFAQSTGAVKINTKDIPREKEGFLEWISNFYRKSVDYTTVYSYTLDTYAGYTHYVSPSGELAPVTIMSENHGLDIFRDSMDIEYYGEDEYYESMKQSPIITMQLKGDTGDLVASIGKLNYRTNTNWWGDSLIQLKGVFDETSAFFTLKVDSAPSWENNMVTLIPFFFGNLVSKNTSSKNETPIAMLGGRQVGEFFDFDSIETKTEILQPITRNYVNHPSNGVDSVMIKKTKYGARYQEHFLRWNVPPNLMPPTREELRLVKNAQGTEKEEEYARKYPRAWNYLRYGYYQYDFHASRYSNKIHTSRATVMHPEDGVLGYIPNIVLLPVINVSEGEKLVFPYWCEECNESQYQPEVPKESTKLEWGIAKSTSELNNLHVHLGDSTNNSNSNSDKGNKFSYYCDGAVRAQAVDDTYWNPSVITQDYLANSTDGIGKELSKSFWEGRNDWLDYLQEPQSQYHLDNSKIKIEDFHKFLWKTLKDIKDEGYSLQDRWLDFNEWGKANLPCLNELQKASVFMSAKLNKPVLFFPGSEEFLKGDILDKMLPLIKKVPNAIYDWIDFNNVFIENEDDTGLVGAWVMDSFATAMHSNGKKENILSSFRSLVNFEPQVLLYNISAAKAHRPYDYIKPNLGFGSHVVDGEYKAYYLPDMTNDNYIPYVAAEVAVHEMGHALSNYGYDILGEKLHEMQEWLDISGWIENIDGSFNELTKSSPGTALDNGKLAPVSDYGCFSPAEDFAEAFMMYIINRQFLASNFKDKHDFIVNKLKEMGIDSKM
ncbi:hypothetical protein [Bacillus cereus]|uniref:hypothetical protein n=1 Tax=Bacillus cereus TaxID=1396 RepID=UPI0018CC88CF|nr:hypothetical protein [Bacillus cereus]MBG9612538.1 hypothetical protein [Bacillus cereus]MBG9714782.1 hypothetical protein [Bacillus cereus]